MRRLIAVLVILGLLGAGLVVLTADRTTAATTRHGGWADQIVWSVQGDGSLATQAMDAGTMNMWLYFYSTQAQLSAAQSDPNIGLITTAGSVEDMLYNPSPLNATAAATLFNPFSIREVREAMNYLVDRSYITREIYGGSAFPMTAVEPTQSPEVARDPVFYAGLDAKYAYNPTIARNMVTEALTGVPNVAFTNGQWLYKGTPIVIKLLARVEDQRQLIGDYVGAQLRTLGFTVDVQHIVRATSTAVVYSGDPTGGAWNAYTEGFSTTALTAWPDTDPYYFYCGGNGEPFFTVNGGLYEPPAALNDACNRLLAGQYTDVASRQALFETTASQGAIEGVRSWLAAGATFPYAKKTIAPFVYDLAGGTWSFYSTRATQLLDANGNPKVGGVLQIGNKVGTTGQWSPWAQSGFSFLYDVLAFDDMFDYGVWPDPHTGLYIPIRANFSVTTAGPTGTMGVPTTAWWFDATSPDAGVTYNNTWKHVASGTTATSEVVFNYTWGPWHDGQQMNMTDVLYAVSLIMRRNYGDIFAKDALASGFLNQLFAQLFKGLEVIDSTHLAIYLNYWHIDPTVIATTADVFPSVSWDESELAMMTVEHGWTDVSETTGKATGLTPIDLTKGRSIGFLDREMANNVTGHLVPGFTTGPFQIGLADAAARFAALRSFRAATGHYYASNGPYYLSRIDTSAGVLVFNNTANYPFTADHWANLIVPKVPATTVTGPSQILLGLPASFNMTSSVQGAPYDSITTSYLVINPATNSVVLSGPMTKVGTGQWQAVLNGAQTASLGPGAYTLETVTVGTEAAVPSFSTVSFTAISQLAYFQGQFSLALGDANSRIANLQNSLNSTNAQLTSAQNTINSLSGLLYVSIAVAVVAVVVAALSVVLLFRRMPKSGGRGGPPEMEDSEAPKGPEEL